MHLMPLCQLTIHESATVMKSDALAQKSWVSTTGVGAIIMTTTINLNIHYGNYYSYSCFSHVLARYCQYQWNLMHSHNSPTIDITNSEMLPTMKELTELPPLHSMLVPVILAVAVATAVELRWEGTGTSGVIPRNMNGPQGGGVGGLALLWLIAVRQLTGGLAIQRVPPVITLSWLHVSDICWPA